jgi:hypothetical protein
VSGPLIIGEYAPPASANSDYTLEGGTLSAASETVGIAGPATFHQLGGTNTIAGNLMIGTNDRYTFSFDPGVTPGTLTVGGDETLSDGPGLFNVISFAQNGGVHTVAGTTSVGTSMGNCSFDLDTGTFITGNLILNNGVFNHQAGDVAVGGTLTINGTSGLYDFYAGTLTANITDLEGALSPTGGLLVESDAKAHLVVLQGNGIMRVDAGGQVKFDTAGGSNAINGVDVENSGNIALTAGSDIDFTGGGIINNNSGGVFDLQIDAGLTPGGGTFNNLSGATLQKSGGNGTSTLADGITFTNSGTVDGQTGTLDLACGGTNSSAINSENSATVKLGGLWTLNGGAFGGAGITNAYGNLTVMGDVTASTDFQLAGTLQGSGYTFTSTNLLELLDGSTLSSPSSSTPLTVTSESNMNVTGSQTLASVVLNAQGSTYQTGGLYEGINASASTIINNSGTWQIADDSRLLDDGTGAFNNSGNFLKTGGTGTSAVTFAVNNTGTISAESGTLDLQNGGSSTGGTFAASSGAVLGMGGNWTLNSGTSFSGAGIIHAYGTLTQTASVSSSADFQLDQYGILQGAGTTFTSTNLFEWDGTVANNLVIAGGSNLSILGASSGAILSNGTLTNNGTATVEDSGRLYISDVGGSPPSAIINTGTFSIGDNALLAGSGTTAFTNTGTLLKTGDPSLTSEITGFAVNNSGTINAQGGTLEFDNDGVSSGTFTAGANGHIYLAANWTLNGGSITGAGIVEAVGALTVNNPVTNSGHMQLDAYAVLQGPAQFTNSGQFDWSGNINMPSPLVNTGTMTTLPGGALLTSTVNNSGTIDATNSLTGQGSSVINNTGTVAFNGDGGLGVTTFGAGDTFNNQSGGVFEKTAGTISSVNRISYYFNNHAGATVNLQAGNLWFDTGESAGTFNTSTSTQLEFLGDWAFTGGTIAGNGYVELAGNTTVSGSVNASVPSITVSGTTSIVSGGHLSFNAMTVTGQVSLAPGGTLSGASIAANGDFYFSGGTFSANVDNNGYFEVSGGGTQTLSGTFYNEAGAELKTDHTTFVATGGLTNAGTFISDPADNYIHQLNITRTGALVGGKGDRFFISTNLTSDSTNRAVWNTADAELLFEGGGTHTFSINGVDFGATAQGYDNNFGWGTLSLALGDQLVLENASGGSDAALYLQTLSLPGGIAELGSIESDGVNIYYDPTLSADEYLADGTYALSGGGFLLPDPADPEAVIAPRSFTFADQTLSATSAVPLPAQAWPAGALLMMTGAMIARRRLRKFQAI